MREAKRARAKADLLGRARRAWGAPNGLVMAEAVDTLTPLVRRPAARGWRSASACCSAAGCTNCGGMATGMADCGILDRGGLGKLRRR